MRQIFLIYFFFLGAIHAFGQFSWRNDTPVFPDADIDGHTYSNVGGIPSRNVTIAPLVQGSALTWQSSNPRVAASSASRLILGVNYTSNNPANAFVSITFTFSEAVCGLSFPIYEIDLSATPNTYVDQVEITATTVTGAALPTPGITPSSSASVSGNVITGTAVDNTASPGASTLITYPANECVKTLTITYRTGMDVQANPSVQLISLGDMTWNTALPVRLISFKSEAQSTGVELMWQTGEETDNSHFDIEKSSNAQHFEAIGRVSGKGSGNVKQVYSFFDASPKNGPNYYRLKQVDFDGTFEYSRIVSSTFTGSAFFKVYPNPVSSVLGIELPDETKIESAFLYDLLGRQIKEFSTEVLKLEGIDNGIYFLYVHTKDGRIFRERILKMN
jgi:Secretion system C-terminal sorting domain